MSPQGCTLRLWVSSVECFIQQFPVLLPDITESERVINEIVNWFKIHEK